MSLISLSVGSVASNATDLLRHAVKAVPNTFDRVKGGADATIHGT